MMAGNSTTEKRQTRPNQRVRSRGSLQAYRSFPLHLRLSLLILPPMVGSVVLLAPPAGAQSENLTNGPASAAVASSLLNLGVATNTANPGNSPGLPATELLQGNGTGLGYTLKHSAILTDTLSVHVGGNLLKRGVDYWVDPDSGALYFATGVRSYDSISVYYRYLDSAGAPSKPKIAPGLQLDFGGNTRLGLSFGASSDSLYGLSLDSKFGAGGKSSYGGLLYFAKSLTPAKAASATPGAPSGPQTAASPMSGLDHFISQNLALQSGGLRFHADYQDVGKAFGGFAA